MEQKMKEMINWLNYHTKLYDEGKPEISDFDWDKVYFELQEIEKKSGIVLPDSPTAKIKYEAVTELKKVKHNHFLGSLAKTKDWNEFKNYFTKPAVAMLKLDGLTCSLRYIDGKLVSAETRGDGEEGEDILHNANVIRSIPKRIDYKEELIVDGEVVCKYKDFEKFAEEYKNPRNFAAGSIRLLDSKECDRRNLTFVAWKVEKGFEDTSSFKEKLNKLADENFVIVPYCDLNDDAEQYLKDKAEYFGLPIDGLVARFDDIEYGLSLGSTSHHEKSAYAFKFYDEEVETRLKYIEWSLGRTGVLTPVAVVEPIEIEGTTVERCSLHNVSIMKETMGDCCYCGQKVKIFKANAIIPQISWAYKMSYGDVISCGGVTCDGFSNDYGIRCPACNGDTVIETSDSGVQNLVCINPNCEGKLINRIEHFGDMKKGLAIKGLSKATIEKLIEWGWLDSIISLFTLKEHRVEWANKAGFGDKSVDKILNAIEESKHCELWQFISSLGIPLIGSTIAKDLAIRFNTWDEFRKSIKEGFNFMDLDGYGYEKHYALSKFDYTEADKIAPLLILSNESANRNENQSLANKIFVITGKLKYGSRDKVKEVIEKAGGKVASTVSSKTDYLIANAPEDTAKYKRALELGIKIVTEDEIKKLFDIL